MSSRPKRDSSAGAERRERRSVSPSKNSTDGTKSRHRSIADAGGEREKRRTRRPRPTSSSNQAEMGWTRASKSPARQISTSRDVASRQLKQLPNGTSSGDIDKRLTKDGLKRDASSRSQGTTRTSGSGGLSSVSEDKQNERTSVKEKRMSNKDKKVSTAAASNRDIDEVIAQFREHCDVHMATLLELKNNITSTEKTVVQSTEKDKEFAQVRKWYSQLVEKHTKLQKEHQALQEEHLALQEKYMNLKQASKLEGSFADLNPTGMQFKNEKKKKDKKDKKGLGEIVWQRAGNIKNKLNHHQQLQ